MLLRFENKVVLVTGSSRGIGRATAIRFAQEGAKVVWNYPLFNNPEFDDRENSAAASLKTVFEEMGAETLCCIANVANADEVRAMVDQTVEKFGTIDVLVNNAGVTPFCDFFDVTEELWDYTMNVNLKSMFLCSQMVAKIMIGQKVKGKIINVSSISSLFGGTRQSHYTASKGGVNQLTRSLAIILGRHGITCNAVLPGSTLTDMNRENLSDPVRREMLLGRIPLGRFGVPEDQAAAIAMLASDDANFINGAMILVDGGMAAFLQ